MEFLAAVLFLILYFVRPHDWIPFMSGLEVIKPVIALGVIGLVSRRQRAPKWGWLTTPHEFVMMCYFARAIYAEPDWLGMFMSLSSLMAFYFLTVQALTDGRRMEVYFRWWTACVTFMCLVGVAADFGIDLTNAKDLIDGQLGRLCLNTWLLDNPNALGHMAVTAFPLIFCIMTWRRDIGIQLLSIPLLMMVAQCVVATGSKGAYISGAAGLAAALLVGRSFGTTVVLALLLAVGGSTATSMLPRMTTGAEMKYDEGIMGRAMAFEAARTAYETTPAGWNRFVANFQWMNENKQLATHSSIVQVGADQGPLGLFLYLSIMGCVGRSLLTMKTESEELERCRRLMFALLVGYFVSGWMINRSYSAEFFLICGAATAFHRLAREQILREKGLNPEVCLADTEEPEAPEQAPIVRAGGDEFQGTVQVEHVMPQNVLKRIWNRYGLVDLAIAYCLLSFTLWFWDYLISYFKPT